MANPLRALEETQVHACWECAEGEECQSARARQWTQGGNRSVLDANGLEQDWVDAVEGGEFGIVHKREAPELVSRERQQRVDLAIRQTQASDGHPFDAVEAYQRSSKVHESDG